tara:strand:+ start:61 stop:1164 length:1104 start_codon:yes stop_codon:yes gene_type:complete
MTRRFKFKINGENPRSLLLAFVLAKLKCDIYIYDFLQNSNSKNDSQIFLLSNYSKNLLSKFNIWNEINDISYGFTSLCLKDNIVSEQLLLRTENSPNKKINNIGWTVKYSDIKNLLIRKLINYENVHFISRIQLSDESLNFDYEFNFNSYEKFSNLFKFPLSRFKILDNQILIFNVYLRGHINKRLYEINTTEGLIVFTPINKNMYQVIWNNPSFRIKETSLLSKSLFLDNLTTLLPNEFQIDQIIGDINSMLFNNFYSTCFIRNKSIYFNENKFKSNTIYNFNFDFIIRNILQIYIYLKDNKFINVTFLNKTIFYYLLRLHLKIITYFSLSNFLIYLFTINNIFSLFLRKLLFTLLKKVNLIKLFL